MIAALAVAAACVGADPRVPPAIIAAADEIMTSLTTAFNRGDGTAVAALYSPDVVDVQADGSIVRGSAAIQANLAAAFAGPLKGARLTVRSCTIRGIRADVFVATGTYEEIVPGQPAGTSLFQITVAKASGKWLIQAGLAATKS
jgi:uncharacterized protein (TIGR02246 family)